MGKKTLILLGFFLLLLAPGPAVRVNHAAQLAKPRLQRRSLDGVGGRKSNDLKAAHVPR